MNELIVIKQQLLSKLDGVADECYCQNVNFVELGKLKSIIEDVFAEHIARKE